MKFRIIVILFLSAHLGFAQPLTIKEITLDSMGYRFPIFESPQRPAVAKKINALIQKEWNFNPASQNPWSEMNLDESADFGYEVSANNEHILSLNIESSYAACGLHVTRSDYTFDSKTGDFIDINKVFGTDGLAKLRRSLFKTWKVKCKAAAEDKEESRADEYRECLNASDAEKRTELNFGRLQFTDNGIRFWAGSCLEGTEYDFQADRTHGPHDYSLGMLLPMLTPYGFSLFAGKGTAPLQTLLRGTIDGKYLVSLTLLPGDGDTIKGMIVYDRVGEPLNLVGTMNGNQITFHELEGSTMLSNIETSWDGSKLSGMFTNLKTKKMLPFVATVVK